MTTTMMMTTTTKIQRRRKRMSCCSGGKAHQRTRRRKLKSKRILRETQMKRKRKAKRGTLSYVCPPEAPVWGPTALCSCLEIQVWGDVFLLGLPFLLSNEGETHCEDDVYRLPELENILVAPFNSTCALNSGLKEGCTTQSKERSCSWQQGRELEKMEEVDKRKQRQQKFHFKKGTMWES